MFIFTDVEIKTHTATNKKYTSNSKLCICITGDNHKGKLSYNSYFAIPSPPFFKLLPLVSRICPGTFSDNLLNHHVRPTFEIRKKKKKKNLIGGKILYVNSHNISKIFRSVSSCLSAGWVGTAVKSCTFFIQQTARVHVPEYHLGTYTTSS
jgi:hypothetical protein